jgi:hypothetical protein
MSHLQRLGCPVIVPCYKQDPLDRSIVSFRAAHVANGATSTPRVRPSTGTQQCITVRGLRSLPPLLSWAILLRQSSGSHFVRGLTGPHCGSYRSWHSHCRRPPYQYSSRLGSREHTSKSRWCTPACIRSKIMIDGLLCFDPPALLALITPCMQTDESHARLIHADCTTVLLLVLRWYS